ncbi:hypothetical protein [Dictyobacter kobayashii]|uniref:hypothetical protein n=1 Tax=Dictyobacter kobayashii TaxID=2014872 RepID=UPI0013870E6F|nr:hypothetical protein [Dictyobacter kobayashii]
MIGDICKAIEGDSVTSGGRASDGVAGSLQHSLTRIVIQVLIAGHSAIGRDPGIETALVVVGHDRPTLSSITAVTRGGVDIAAGHVAHGIVAGIQPSCSG